MLGPYYESLYRELLELLGRRLDRPGRSTAQQAADCEAALEILERAIWCGTSRDAVLQLPGLERLRSSPRYKQLLDR